MRHCCKNCHFLTKETSSRLHGGRDPIDFRGINEKDLIFGWMTITQRTAFRVSGTRALIRV